MIELVITPRTYGHTNELWWFVEWPEGGMVTPAKELNLLRLVYDEMGYKDRVGFCVQYPIDNNIQGTTMLKLAREANYHVMFVDEFYYFTMNSDYYQQRNYEYIVGMVFKDHESADLFKNKIEARWTFKALQASYE